MFSNIQCNSEPFATCHFGSSVPCHSEPFATCHSEGAERPKNLIQGKLREESLRFFVVPISSGLLRMTLPNTLEG
jgi:hypothetical protein